MIYINKVFIVFIALILAACQSTALSKKEQIKPSLNNASSKTETPVAETTRPAKVIRVSQEQINEWLAAHQYSKALDSLKSVSEGKLSDKDRAQISKIKNLAVVYDKRQSEKIKKLYSAGKVHAATQLLATSIANYPDGPGLYFIKQKIEKEQLSYTKNLESQLLIAKGEWLLQSSPLLQELLRVHPDNKTAIQNIEQNEKEIAEIASNLTALGIHAMSARDFDLADQRLNMAITLIPTTENLAALARLDQIRHKEKIRTRQLNREKEDRKRRLNTRKLVQMQKKKQEQAAKETTSLVEAVKRALARGQLIDAQAKFEKLKFIAVNSADVISLQRSLDDAVNSKVKGLVIRGGEFYSNGNIKKARDLWLSAQALDPDNTNIKRRIKRANQVLNKLRELQSRSGPDTGSN